MEHNHIEIIGVDHGFSMMKTVSQVFTSGVGEITSEPAIHENLLEYEGRYYRIGSERLTVKPTKVLDENYYILTLAAIAKELERRGMRSANIFLAAGLPLTRFGAEKQGFIDYLSKNKEVTFIYEGITYRIRLDKVAVFPQCYAAVVDRMMTFTKKVLVVDIGSWTIDMMPIEEKSPDESRCVTTPRGLITCMRSINEQCVRLLNGEIDESEIQQVMRFGKSDLDDKYFQIVKKEIEAFTNYVYDVIGEHGYNLHTTNIIFVGGGATVMRLFGSLKQKNITFIEDIKANAKGFEQLARMALKANKKIG